MLKLKLSIFCIFFITIMFFTISMAFELDDFSLDLRKCLTPSHHIWVMSGTSTVNPISNTVMGVGEIFSPPFAGRNFKMDVNLKVNDHLIEDTGSFENDYPGMLYSAGYWYPNRVVRNGTYHRSVDGKLVSFRCRSALYPLALEHGFLLQINILNRSKQSISVQICPRINAGTPKLVGLSRWKYGIPKEGSPADSISATQWQNDQVAIHALTNLTTFQLEPSESRTIYVAIVLSEPNENIIEPANFVDWKNATREAWEKRLQMAGQNVPELESDVPGLEDYYRRSLMSGLVCLWENPEFATQPFLATLGIDGGGICTYLWDTGGYVPQASTLLLHDKMLDIAQAFTKINLNDDYAFTLDGTGIGPWYAYNTFSMVSLVWTITNQFGIQPELFNAVRALVEHDEKYLPKSGNLIDYGTQYNLLEMRGMGWEHFVVSPNAERAWCLERLADIGEAMELEHSTTSAWREKAETIRNSIRAELWDDDIHWFLSVYPDGHKEAVYSIQVYDALRAGLCTPEMTQYVIAHLRDGAFLGSFGVSSVSAEDTAHYELNDLDWSGGGAYIGDAPLLAQTLYEIGEPDLAWDVLKRLFWMGQFLPYYPQECYCDKPAVDPYRRANEVSGLAGLQTIVFGMAGFEPKMGSLWIHPQPPSEGSVKLSNYHFKNNSVDLLMEPNNCRIFVNEKQVYEGQPQRIKIIP